jgi:hypothetical protein
VKLRKGHSVAGTRLPATDAASVSEFTGAEWKSNGFLFNGYCYFANVPVDPSAENALSDIMPELPYGNDNYTIETVYDPSNIPDNSNSTGGFAAWGKQGARTLGESNVSNGTIMFGKGYNEKAAAPIFRHYWWDNDIDVKFTDSGSNNIKNFAITYDNSEQASPYNRTFYYNGSENSIQYIGTNCSDPVNYCRDQINKNTARCGSFFIGQTVRANTDDKCSVWLTPESVNHMNSDYANGNKIFSVRVYNKQLTSPEIAANYEVDRRRFTAPPTVTIGGQACSDVVVLSENFLMCKVPAGSVGTKNVVVVSDGVESIYSDAYEYVGSTAFYINTISPIVGTANQSGQTLTLTGNKLDEITKVEVGGEECPDFNVNGAGTTCTFTLPSLPAGEVDIILTVGINNDVYRFAKVFEYQ